MKDEAVETTEPTFKQYSVQAKRRIEPAREGDPALGPLKLLPGTWANIRTEHRLDNPDGTKNPFVGTGSLDGNGQSPLDGRGWNLIALPFIRDDGGPPYRLLMNQYNEVLHFDTVDDKVPNRGISFADSENTDQAVAALDYTQRIRQLAAADDANSGKALAPELDIHHEPGFFLHMKEQTIDGFTIARLATIPHGNAANAVGKFVEIDGPPTIPSLSGMPEGASTFDVLDAMNRGDPDDPSVQYLAPYKFFVDIPFTGVLSPPFPGFHPVDANNLLNLGLDAIRDSVVRTTELVLDTDTMEAGIVNIPFIERQADAALMRSTFWIMELSEEGPFGEPRLLLAYSQFIFLDFFPRRDGRDGFIRWPHISINMMEKIAPAPG
ncbi:MAG: heme-binding protein [Planctomycetes bacterium]|nr:heme-binding protein [Planctomycetota bacterium]